MKRAFAISSIQRVVGLGLLLLSAAAASAGTTLTFQVDMSQQIALEAFDPNFDSVWVQGSFNGWNQFFLTASPGNTNVYTGTIIDNSDANGAALSYLFGDSEINYETTADYHNRTFLLPATNAASVTLPYTYFADYGPTITSFVTFQVDLSGEINCGNFVPGVSTVEVQGIFQGWSSGSTMTQAPSILRTNYQGVVSSNVYVLTLPVEFCTNAANDFKFVMQPNNTYETPAGSNQDSGGNRWFINSSNQSLPVVYFNDVPILVSNAITFEVDMTAQIESGAFSTDYNSVEVHGDFDGWSYGQVLNNNPSVNTNIFSATVTYIDAPGAEHYFQYVIQPGPVWETVAPGNAVGGNRHLTLANINGSFTNGPVYFSDQPPAALMFDTVTVPNCMVTFTVDMTGSVGPFGPFDPNNDLVYINGLYNGANNSFWTWGYFNGPGEDIMSEIGSRMLYTITVPINQGQSLDLIYKYSIDGLDNEAGFLDNHERWVRSLPDYTMPQDTFGSEGSSTAAEISFGNLSAGKSGNSLQLSWLGRGGVHLQTASSLNPGTVWTNLPLTDGTNLMVAPGGAVRTNFPIGIGNHYYRLTGPQ